MSTANQVLPSVTVTEIPPGPSAAPTGIDEVMVVAGPCSKGPYTPTPLGAGALSLLTSTFGTGPAVKAAAYAMAGTSNPLLFLRLPTASVAATKSTVTVVRNNSSDFTYTLSGTPTDGADVVIKFGTVGGNTGTGPIAYSVSLDGGATFGGTQALGTGTSIVVLGVTVTLGSGKVVTANDTIAWYQMPASSTVLPLTQTGTGTSVVTVTGTPNDAYEVIVKFPVGGTIGTAGITYTYSLDGGYTYTPEAQLGTANTLALVDGPLSTEQTGLTLNFAAGTLVAGDYVTFNTTSPAYDASGLTSGTTALKGWNGTYTWIWAVGPVPSSVATSGTSTLSGWVAQGLFKWALGEARDRGTTETLTAWETHLAAEFASYTSTYFAVAAGMARVTCPINGRRNRRPSSWSVVRRLLTLPIQIDFAQRDLGALPDSSITDTNDVVVEHDANESPGLNAMGFVTLRRWPNTTGVYPTKAAMLGPDGDIKRIPVRRVMNVAEALYQAFLQTQAVKTFRRVIAPVTVNGVPYAKDDIYPPDLQKVNRLGYRTIYAGTVARGMCSGINFAIDKTPIALSIDSSQLNATLQLVPLIYVDKIAGEAQVVSAALSGVVTG